MSSFLFSSYLLHFNCKFVAQKKERPFGRPWLVGQLLLANLDPFFKLTKVLFICRFKDKVLPPTLVLNPTNNIWVLLLVAHVGTLLGFAYRHVNSPPVYM